MTGLLPVAGQILASLDQTLIRLFAEYGLWVYVILFGIVFLESTVTPFLPGDSLLFAAGVLATAVVINVHVLVLLFVAAATSGTAFSYLIGTVLGPTAFRGNHRFLDRARLERSRVFLNEHGVTALIIGRFVPVVRTFVPVIAGIVRMPFRRFIFYSTVGSMLWVVLFVYAGYFFGEIPFVQTHFGLIVLVVFVVSLGPLVVERFWRASELKKTTNQSP